MANRFRLKEVEYFAGCVLKDRKMELVPNSDVIVVLQVLDAIRESLITGERVTVG